MRAITFNFFALGILFFSALTSAGGLSNPDEFVEHFENTVRTKNIEALLDLFGLSFYMHDSRIDKNEIKEDLVNGNGAFWDNLFGSIGIPDCGPSSYSLLLEKQGSELVINSLGESIVFHRVYGEGRCSLVSASIIIRKVNGEYIIEGAEFW